MPAKTPAAVNNLFEERVNAGDIEGLLALYESEATVAAGPEGLLVGRAAIRGFLEPLLAMKAVMDMGDITVIALDDNLAVLHHDWRATFTDPDGKQAEMTGKATEVVRRQADGSWLFLLDDPDMRG
ncbi:MAG: SgcJ/EcaC family oxidoreductase [Candidatus Binatia bacterium]